jgi:hypothetical protein
MVFYAKTNTCYGSLQNKHQQVMLDAICSYDQKAEANNRFTEGCVINRTSLRQLGGPLYLYLKECTPSNLYYSSLI